MVMYDKYGLSPDTIANLKAKGHQGFREIPYGRGIGDANSIHISDSVISGIKDPRNEGAALGY
jgi:gamma-glutamyltranspeptidase